MDQFESVRKPHQFESVRKPRQPRCLARLALLLKPFPANYRTSPGYMLLTNYDRPKARTEPCSFVPQSGPGTATRHA